MNHFKQTRHFTTRIQHRGRSASCWRRVLSLGSEISRDRVMIMAKDYREAIGERRQRLCELKLHSSKESSLEYRRIKAEVVEIERLANWVVVEKEGDIITAFPRKRQSRQHHRACSVASRARRRSQQVGNYSDTED